MAKSNFKKNINELKRIEEELDLIIDNTLLKEGFGDFVKSLRFMDKNVSSMGQLFAKADDALRQRIDGRIDSATKAEADKIETAFTIIQRVVASRDAKLEKIVPELKKDIESSNVDDNLKQQLMQKIEGIRGKLKKLEMDLLAKVKPLFQDPLGVDENAPGAAKDAGEADGEEVDIEPLDDTEALKVLGNIRKDENQTKGFIQFIKDFIKEHGDEYLRNEAKQGAEDAGFDNFDSSLKEMAQVDDASGETFDDGQDPNPRPEAPKPDATATGAPEAPKPDAPKPEAKTGEEVNPQQKFKEFQEKIKAVFAKRFAKTISELGIDDKTLSDYVGKFVKVALSAFKDSGDYKEAPDAKPAEAPDAKPTEAPEAKAGAPANGVVDTDLSRNGTGVFEEGFRRKLREGFFGDLVKKISGQGGAAKVDDAIGQMQGALSDEEANQVTEYFDRLFENSDDDIVEAIFYESQLNEGVKFKGSSKSLQKLKQKRAQDKQQATPSGTEQSADASKQPTDASKQPSSPEGTADATGSADKKPTNDASSNPIEKVADKAIPQDKKGLAKQWLQKIRILWKKVRELQKKYPKSNALIMSVFTMLVPVLLGTIPVVGPALAIMFKMGMGGRGIFSGIKNLKDIFKKNKDDNAGLIKNIRSMVNKDPGGVILQVLRVASGTFQVVSGAKDLLDSIMPSGLPAASSDEVALAKAGHDSPQAPQTPADSAAKFVTSADGAAEIKNMSQDILNTDKDMLGNIFGRYGSSDPAKATALYKALDQARDAIKISDPKHDILSQMMSKLVNQGNVYDVGN